MLKFENTRPDIPCMFVFVGEGLLNILHFYGNINTQSVPGIIMKIICSYLLTPHFQIVFQFSTVIV